MFRRKKKPIEILIKKMTDYLSDENLLDFTLRILDECEKRDVLKFVLEQHERL